MRIAILGAALVMGGAAVAHEPMHADHDHAHADECGHAAVMHDDHADYLHDGHLHAAHGGDYDEHVLAVSAAYPAEEATVAHVGHRHLAGEMDHETVPHGDHADFLHDGDLHHQHDDHADNHGKLALAPAM